MDNIRKFKIYDIVFVNTQWTTAEKCKITKFIETNIGSPVYELKSIDGIGVFCAPEDCIFDTKENALTTYEISYDSKVEAYCKQIKTLNDLIKFPIDNCINGEEYTDYPALDAYNIRAKEILRDIKKPTQKIGKWLIEECRNHKYTLCYCSICNSYYTIDKKDEMDYCPNCGAKMEDDKDE